jgi:outer membrane protein
MKISIFPNLFRVGISNARHPIIVVVLLFAFVGANSTMASSILSLEQCVNLALKNNQLLSVKSYEKDSRISQAKSTKSIIMPHVSASLSTSHSGGKLAEYDTTYSVIPTLSGNDAITFPSFSETGNYGNMEWNGYYDLSLNINQNVYDGGKWQNMLKSADVAQEQAKLDFQQARINTVFSVKQAFYQYLIAVRLLDVYKESLNLAQEQHKQAIERFNLGASSISDTLRTLVNVERTKLTVISGTQDENSKRKVLNILLGNDVQAALSIIEPEWKMMPVTDFNRAMVEALRINPRVQNLKYGKESAEYGLKISKSDFLPKVGINLGYSQSSREVGKLFGEGNASLSAGASLSWSLWDGGAAKQSVEQKRIAIKISEENVSYLEKTIESEISTAIENIAQLTENIRISNVILRAAELDHLLVTEEYQLGSASILDVLKIATDLKDAKTKLVQAKYTLKIAEAALEQIIGRTDF